MCVCGYVCVCVCVCGYVCVWVGVWGVMLFWVSVSVGGVFGVHESLCDSLATVSAGCLSVWLPVCLFACPCVCLSVCSSVYLLKKKPVSFCLCGVATVAMELQTCAL